MNRQQGVKPTNIEQMRCTRLRLALAVKTSFGSRFLFWGSRLLVWVKDYFLGVKAFDVKAKTVGLESRPLVWGSKL